MADNNNYSTDQKSALAAVEYAGLQKKTKRRIME